MAKRNVLITGASRGIGLALAHHLSDNGFKIIGAARRAPDVPFPGVFLTADLTSEADVMRLAEKAQSSGAIDCLVNNAATANMQLLGDITMDAVQDAVSVNLKSVILLSQALLPGMRSQRWGRIVNISSRAALGKIGRSVYSATKSALIGLSRSWSLELASDGITVNVVSPGPIATEFFHLHNPPDAPGTKALIDEVPMKRLGRPEEVASAVSYFLRDDAAFVTGQVIYVCGGITVGRSNI